MASDNLITAERVRQVLDYDPATGELRWRERPVEHFLDGKHTAAHTCARWNARFAGKIAGNLRKDGYSIITIDWRRYRAHRLAWLHVTGHWPSHEIDHIDLDPSNNRFDNLRLATRSQNGCNSGAPSTNKSGHKGVSWCKRCQKLRAQITHNGKKIHLGYFDLDKLDEAVAAYAAAVKKYHGEFGRVS